MRRTWQGLRVGCWLLAGCVGPTAPDTDTDVDVDADTDVDSDTDTDTDPDTDPPVSLTTTDPESRCEDDTAVTPRLVATSPKAGQVALLLEDWAQGCCPTTTVTGVADDGVIEAVVGLSDDLCDCVCTLSTTWTFSGVPAGTWSVRAGGYTSGAVVVP
jgi:hypothetical protein